MIYVTIGFRNILKNIRKNILTILMISFGMTALFVYTGSSTHMFSLLRGLVIHRQYGNFQIHKEGYAKFGKKKPYDYVIADYSVLQDALLGEPSISYVVPRLHFSGILSSDEKSIVVKGFGGVALSEAQMEYGNVNTGSLFTDDGKAEAILGELALKKVSSTLEERLTLMVSMKGGGVSAADFEITGTKKSYGETDTENRMFIMASLKDVQSLMDMENSVDTVLVHLVNDKSMKKAEKAIARICAANGFEYTKWTDLAVFYLQVKNLFSVNQYILTAILLVISIFVIVNTLYMSFMERIREIGTIRAVGTTKRQVRAILVSEGIALSGAGGFLGIAIGSAIAFAVNLSGGIFHPASVFNEMSYNTLILPQGLSIAVYWFLFVLVSALASVAISFRALRLSIADSLRWN